MDSARRLRRSFDVPRRTLLLRVSSFERAALEGVPLAADITSVFCETDAAFVEAFHQADRGPGICGVVWELSSRMPPRAEALPQALLAAAANARLLIRADINPAAMREIAALARLRVPARSLEWYVSLAGIEDDELVADVRALVSDRGNGNVDQVMLAAVDPRIAPAVRTLVATTIVAGRRRRTVRALAERLDWKVRTMESALRRARAPELRGLLSWSLILHAVWHVERLGLGPKQVAHLAGYRGVSAAGALAEHIHRHTGLRLRTLTAHGTFVSLLDRFVQRFPPS
jgi:hypothetical protein